MLANSGLMIRSNVERTNPNASWLDQHGDYIQILVLQNYLFFGNASSCLHYIQSMFEDPPDSDFPLPPIPKYLIIDFRLVTGMDASAVDVLADTFTLCQSSKCKLFFSGLSPNLRSVLSNGGLKPITLSSDRTLKFYSDLETALGKSEDGLLREVRKVEVMESQETVRRKQRVGYEERSGFRSALDQIDDQVRI